MVLAHPRRLLATLFATLAVGVTASAQVPVPRAYFYTEPGFQGECFTVEAGTNLDNLANILDSQGQPFNDRIHSIQLEGPLRLVVFRHAGFSGESIWINGDVADLRAYAFAPGSSGSWARNISSAQLEGVGQGVVVFYRWDRRDAERAIRSSYLEYFGREPDPAGQRHYLAYLLQGGWTLEQLHQDLRRSAEFRNRDVDGIIRREYRQVLGRDPDASGMNAYRRAMSRGMTIGELRTDLRRSGEGNQKSIHDAISRAYRELLKRDPDPEGLANYIRLMQQGMSERDVREALKRSDEYQKTRGR